MEHKFASSVVCRCVALASNLALVYPANANGASVCFKLPSHHLIDVRKMFLRSIACVTDATMHALYAACTVL